MTKDDFIEIGRLTRDTIQYRKSMVDITGELISGILLDYIVQCYENNPGAWKDGSWMSIRSDGWWKPCRVEKYTSVKAIKRLVDMGLLQKEKRMIDGRPYNCIRPTEQILTKLNELLQVLNQSETR